jgi:hypothetical protein
MLSRKVLLSVFNFRWAFKYYYDQEENNVFMNKSRNIKNNAVYDWEINEHNNKVPI